jgi:hypothetical protein
LQPLFFLGLNTGPSEVNLIGINRGGQLGNLIGDVPYLNGGLFEKDADDENARISVPDAGLDEVVNGLFEQFNFTITESTPLDIEVAVDPEMLGKIFEELVTGRHDTGSYYTPKPIVSFMCREALKGYFVIFSGDKSKFRLVGRFSPRSNPEFIAQVSDTELNTVIATDVLSEGLNLQDCDTIINYDLHWNPVRLSRPGRKFSERPGPRHRLSGESRLLPLSRASF